jgi:NAD(P)-dependent dehydrogenase (short-subunit alcohol dehydrogenase family)
MLLEKKNAILYGAAGGLGSGIARAFAREGARVFLTGRTQRTLDALAASITAAGGQAEAAVVDALDEAAVNAHAQAVAARAGSLDVSFNLIPRGDVQGVPLIDMSAADLVRAVNTGLTTQLITARAAARQMVKQHSGVILMVTSGTSAGAPPMMGSTGPADAAMELLMRSLAAELGPQGVRVLGIWTAAVAETLTAEKIGAVNSNMKLQEEAVAALVNQIGQMTLLKRAPRLAQVADTAAFLASDQAGGLTGTIVNVTCGLVPR